MNNKGQRRALFVFNNKFKDKRFNTLSAAPEDVDRMVALFQQSNVGFDADNITVLSNPSLVDFRSAVLKFFRQANKDDYLFLYYAGHGIRSQNAGLYLALRSSTLDGFEADALDASFIKAQLESSFAERKVLMLDCCHAGAIREAGRYVSRDAGVDPGLMDDTFDPEGSGTYVLGASQSHMSAYETEKDGKRYSLFTDAFIEGVQTGAAAGGKPVMTLADIAGYIHSKRKSEGIETRPYLDISNAVGLLEFAENPNPEMAFERVPTRPPNVLPPLQTASPPSGRSKGLVIGGIALAMVLGVGYGINKWSPWTGTVLPKLTHAETCAQNPELNIDLSNAANWIAPDGVAARHVSDRPELWSSVGDWISLTNDGLVRIGAERKYDFDLQFCSCGAQQAVVFVGGARSDDYAEMFIDDVNYADLDSNPRETDPFERAEFRSESSGNRKLRMRIHNGLGGPMGFQMSGRLRAQKSYLGLCRL